MTTYPLPHTSKKLFFHNIVVGMALYCLMVQGIPWYQVNPIPRAVTAPQQQPNTRQTKSIKLQYTSANHVLGFGTSQVVVGSRTHALTMTLSNAKAVDPIVEQQEMVSNDESISSKDLPASFLKQTQPFSNTVTYVHPWPKVTVLYKPKSNAIVESEYHIEPGFNKQTIKQIIIHYNRPVEIDDQGRLLIKYDLGTMQESAPIAWQIIDGQKVYVPVRFKKLGTQEIGFYVSDYNSNFPLIIDPSLVWNSFIGQTDSGEDFGAAIALDVGDNMYIAGYSYGPWGNPIRGYSSGQDAFLSKLDSNGNLLWNTFLGGVGDDNGSAIVVDTSGNIIVGGTSYTTWGSPVQAYIGARDAFVAKLDSSGNLLWNTFSGGAGDDIGAAIAIDTSGNIVAGGTSFATWGSPVRAHTGTRDAFVVKLDSNGNLQWNTFLGGAANDIGNATAVDTSGNIVIGGYSSATWASPIRAYSGLIDAYVAKLDGSGNLLWNTFLGSAGNDFGYSISVDTSSNVLAGGQSRGSWGSPVRAYSSGNDAFAAKLDSSGNLLWNTFLGGTGDDYGFAISVDTSGNVMIGGNSTDTWGSPVRIYDSNDDTFAAKLDSSGNLIWNTFLGGAGDDSIYAIAVDGSNNVYGGGYSPNSWGTPIRNYSSGNDAIAAKLDSNGNLLWNTFLGSTGADYGYALAADGSGNFYLAGSSNSRWGSPLRSYSNSPDAYVAKLDSTGNLIWHTFLGGTGLDNGLVLVADGSNNIYIGGHSNTTWGSPVRGFSGGTDTFAAKLDSSGNLIWNTFLGSAGDDYGYAISVDGSNDVFVGGRSNTSWGVPVRGHSGGSDTFAAQLDSSGNLLWNTFLGGAGQDSCNALAVDVSSNIVVGGYSSATWGLPTRSFTSSSDIFVAKLDNSGNLLWNTFLGGTGSDTGFALDTDGSNNIYVGGISDISWGVPVRGYSSGIDAFTAKLDSNGNLLWNTFLGGAGNEYGYVLGSDSSNNIYIGGYCNSSWGSPIWSYSSGSDIFAVKLDSSGNLLWNAFLGGAGNDYGRSIAFDGSDNVYLGGYSSATWGSPVMSFNNSLFDAFVVKINDPPPTPTNTPTATITSTATHSPTPTQTPSITPTPTVSPTYSPTAIASPTPTATASPTLSPSPTKTEAALTSLLSNLIIYPNPFRAPSQQVTIQYMLSEDADVTITLYSYLGTKIKSIQIRAGENGGRGNSTGLTNQITWDGRNNLGLLQSTGGYICQVVAKSSKSGQQEKITSKIGLMR